MPKAKSFIKSLAIDYAKKSHNCQHNKNHRISRGNIRLGLKEGRSPEYYCKDCSIKFLEKSAESIMKLLEALKMGYQSKK